MTTEQQNEKTPARTGPSGPIVRLDQEHVLNRSIKKATPAVIFLRNGPYLKGKVRAHDAFTVLLDTDKGQVMVYKHAITSIILSAGRRRKAG